MTRVILGRDGDIAEFLWLGGQHATVEVARDDDNVHLLTIYNTHPAVRIRVPLVNLDVVESMVTDAMVDAALLGFHDDRHAEECLRVADPGDVYPASPRVAMRSALIAALNARQPEGK